MPSRFAILHHTGFRAEHWDLMLEDGDVLLTWELPREPSSPDALPMPVTRIGDHRKLYLDYEGPVSRNRGEVTRFDGGGLQILERSEVAIRFELSGEKLAGRFRLDRKGETDWVFSLQG